MENYFSLQNMHFGHKVSALEQCLWKRG